MLRNVFAAKEEKITKSQALAAELAGAGITAERRNELLMRLEALTGDVLRPIIQEVLNDINSLPELLRGKLIAERKEGYDVEVDNLAKSSRYGWEIVVIDGKKMQYDPAKPEPVYEEIPKMVIERIRSLFDVSTNRAAIGKIEELLQAFLVRVRGEFQHVSIDVILEEKRLCELEISKVDRTVMSRETMNEATFTDSGYIKKPYDRMKAVGPDVDLFNRFNSLQQGIPG